MTKLKKIFENIIDERLEDPSDVKDDVLRSLLKLVGDGDGDEELTLDDIKHLLMIFAPERYLEREIDVKGRDFELIPFGSGRRMCPGIPLAYRMIHLMLGTLLDSFNWENGKGTKDINMAEKFGITLQKVEPLQAIPLPR
uniref:Cytochrome P450 n=1 Tax=Chenopodium quinoa TaxID=63459 RepID=A0A803M2C2_CHEQI